MSGALGVRIFLRSLLVQASWSFSAMQGAGFFLMSWPALARRGAPPDQLCAGGLRHLRFYNSHPYFGGLVAAVVAREEGDGAPPETVDALKQALMCALGALGDEFFWATLRPLAAVAALPAAMAGRTWAPLILLVVFNVPHLAVRAWGVGTGLAQGRGVLEHLQRVPLARSVPALGVVMAFGTGLALGAGADSAAWGLLPGRGPVSVAVAAVAFGLLVLALVRRGAGSQGRLLSVLSALAVLAAAARVVIAR
jgi:PTS system mannose-specific IID component